MKKTLYLLISLCFAAFLFVFGGCDFMTTSNFMGTSNKNDNTTNKVYYLGETATTSENVDYIVTSVKNTTKIGSEETENNFIIVTVKITNNGKEVWDKSPSSFILLCDGAEYEYNFDATLSLPDHMSYFTEINPGISKTVNIAFETPNKSTESLYSIKLERYSAQDSITIKLQERE